MRLQLSPNRREEFGMERIVTAVMSQMQAMAASQQRLMELIFAQPLSVGRSLKSLSALADPLALEDRPRAAFARQPSGLALVEAAAHPADAVELRVEEVCEEAGLSDEVDE